MLVALRAGAVSAFPKYAEFTLLGLLLAAGIIQPVAYFTSTNAAMCEALSMLFGWAPAPFFSSRMSASCGSPTDGAFNYILALTDIYLVLVAIIVVRAQFMESDGGYWDALRRRSMPMSAVIYTLGTVLFGLFAPFNLCWARGCGPGLFMNILVHSVVFAAMWGLLRASLAVVVSRVFAFARGT